MMGKIKNKKTVWDIFCTVVDNFGDIGICWRLSRQLANDYNICVRLFVDDLASFQKICHQVVLEKSEQPLQEVLVVSWSETTDWSEYPVADVIIEALAGTVPENYVQKIAECSGSPLWLKLEYLSAEDWIESCHSLVSLHPQLPLKKYFFFPGFTNKTGGLLKELDIQQQKKVFLQSSSAQQQFWQQLGIVQPQQYKQKISLFAYGHPQIASLLSYWQQSDFKILCLVPEGQLAKRLSDLLPVFKNNSIAEQGSLTIKILPFLSQQDYDKLLWSCDINFVRGEDSVIRAHWAEKPFIWQLYRQDDELHLKKLQAFLQRYTAAMPSAMSLVVYKLFLDWNTEADLVHNWLQFVEVLPEVTQHNQFWQQYLEQNGDLASNLVRFAEKNTIIPRNFSNQKI